MADGKSDSDSEDVIVRDSIIKNKERTKSYWEHLMMAAASENQNMVKVKSWEINETSHSNPPSNRNSVSSNDYTEETLNNHKEITENGDAEADLELELRNVKDEKRRIEREIRLQKDRNGADYSFVGLTMEDRIAMELQEMRAREEELKQLRNKLIIETSKDITPSKDTIISNGIEELSSLHTTDGSNYSEYGSEEKEHSLDGNNSRVNTPYSEDFMHRRTQSLDSVSSGHSSGSGSTLNDRERESTRRRILVRPYEDPEEEQTTIFKKNDKETPIEREIRLAKEREEELKREKGVLINNDNNNNNSETEIYKIQTKLGNKKDALQNDTRGVQHRLATNRIQQEIEAANERENELRTEGKILTTSEETVDAKVTRFTQLAESAILENRFSKEQKPMKRSSSMSQLIVSMNNEEKPKVNNNNNINHSNNSNNNTTPIKTYVPQVTRKFATNPAQKGLMQRFIATRGQISLSPINTSTPKFSTNNVSKTTPKRFTPRKLLDTTETPVIPIRKGYTPVEEKIQEELKEMQKREEELRLQRAYMQSSKAFARSQPNLLEISQEEEDLQSWTSHKENDTKTTVPRLSHSVSNPNLLDDGLEKVNRRTSRKKFSLLQEWENRIQSIQQEV